MPHRHNPEAEKHLDVYHDVHNHGWIALADYMGNDTRIAEAARQSTSGKSKGEKKDRELLFYMFEHQHTSPFEMVELVWHVRMPIFVMRQWIRHRTASVNEYSGRYSKMKNEFYIPDIMRARTSGPDEINYQGSDGSIPVEVAVNFQEYCEAVQANAWDEYEANLKVGFAKEMARINLPLSIYTTCMWKMDLHNLFHFMSKRFHKDAQYEIQAYADAMWPAIQAVAPVACDAFKEFALNAKRLSATQAKIFDEIIKWIEDYPEDDYVTDLLVRMEEAGFYDT